MIEKFLGIGLIGTLVGDFLGLGQVFEKLTLICGASLAIIYLFANWWINRPPQKTLRTILVNFLYGLTSSCLTFALLFKLLYLSGADQLSVLSFYLIIVTVSIDLVSSINKIKVINKATIWRLSILTLIVTAYFFIPEDYRVSIKYRKDPDFIKYYELNKETQNFNEISDNYFKRNKPN